jgi:two-component sensor histidine kinase/ligand-binding sensor domain-containing protein
MLKSYRQCPNTAKRIRCAAIFAAAAFFLSSQASLNASLMPHEASTSSLRKIESSIAQYLDSHTVRKLLHDEQGRLWIGTQSGLFLVDGSEQVFRPKLSTSNSVWTADIADAVLDETGRIWVLTVNSGLFLFAEGAVENPTRFDLGVTGSHSLQITEEHAWVAHSRGISVFPIILGLPDRKENRIDIYRTTSLTTNISITKSGKVCTGHDTSLHCWNKKSSSNSLSGKKIEKTGAPEFDEKLTVIHRGKDHSELLVGTKAGSLWRYDLNEDQMELVCKVPKDRHPSITAINYYSSEIIFGTDGGVYWQPDRSRRHCASMNFRELNASHITGVFQVNNLLWITKYKGASVLTRTPFVHYAEWNTSIHDEVMAFAYDDKLGLFVGTYDGLYVKPNNSSQFFQVPLKLDSYGSEIKRVMSISSFDRALFIAPREGGLVELALGEKFVSNAVSSLGSITVTTQTPIDKMSLMLGTFSDGVWIFNTSTQEAYYVEGTFTETGNSPVTGMAKLSDSEYVVSTETEIYFLCEVNSVWRVCNSNKAPNAPSTSRLLSVAKAPDRRAFYVGTQSDGLFMFVKSNSDEWLASKVNLHNHNAKSIFTILSDGNGFIWLGTSQGLLRLSRDGELTAEFYEQHGLQGDDFNYGAALRLPNGKLLFGGSNGFNEVDTRHLRISTSQPKLFFRGLFTPKRPEQQHCILDGDIALDCRIPFDQRFFRLLFHLPDFINPSRVQYRYKLHPFDETWVDGSSQGFANYTNVSPGRYTFHVQGANSAGVWDREGVQLAITVLPPWWRTWWAYAAYALLAVFIVYMIKRWYDANMLTKRARAIADERTLAADAALDTAQAQLETHDKLMHGVRKRNIRTLDLIDELIQLRSSFLPDDVSAEIAGRGTQQIHALSLVERSLSYIHDSIYFSPRKFSADCLAFFTETLGGSFTTAAINDVEDVTLQAEDGMALALVMHELVANAFQHAFQDDADAPFVRVTLREAPGEEKGTVEISLAVEDNGSGLPESAVGDQPGLALVQRIVSHYKGALSFSLDRGTRVETSFVFSDPRAPDSDVVSNP